ncbi:putative Serpin family protein [Medicago truncatula]|uniref:Putative Serpin family protein n=1 Tax=Medicago truncatula TaxID=3880 RepID=G7J5S4_MEDTR|nr:serpin-ZX [Medicago truncatula]AES73240.1 serpin-like protein [Medicago truncatula]RHN70249.1 putative Serpin family protein [Medicago truncatula]
MNLQSESISNLNKFSVTIAKHLFSKEEFKEKNVVFSPLSLHVVLSIIAAGAEGPTQDQLLTFLQSRSTDELKSLSSQLVSYLLADATPAGGPLLSFVNGVWVEQSLTFQHSFKETVATDFKSNTASVDFVNKAFEGRKEVNLWAEKETNGLIKDLLPPDSVDSLTNLIFANALYFKGAWSEEFDTSKTKDYDFNLLNGSQVKVPFMTSMKRQFISVFDGFKVLRLFYKHEYSYKQSDKRYFSIYFFLPDAKDGLLALTEKVASESEFLEHTRPRETVIVGDLRIPKFNIAFGLETSGVLKELGVVLPFSTGGLTNMVDSPMDQNLHISNIFHKSFIEVNEKGTEAAAVTSMGQKVTCGRRTGPPPTPIDFVADHPFLFLIREDLSGTVLFIGQVLNPLLK